MELNRPLATVTPTLDGDVLMLLAGHDGALTTGDMRRMLDRASQEGIRKVLARLSRQGIVLSERAGRVFLYRLNRDHLAAGPVMQLSGLQRVFLGRLSERLETWPARPLYAAVFGSAARGDMTPDSDVDLFLLRSDDTPSNIWDDQVGDLAADVTRWTGNDARPLDYTLSELHQAHDEPVLHAVLAEGVTVVGRRSWLAAQLRGKSAQDADKRLHR